LSEISGIKHVPDNQKLTKNDNVSVEAIRKISNNLKLN